MTVKRKEVFFFDGKTAECVLASDYDALRQENERLVAANKARAEYLTTRRAGNDVDSYVNLAEAEIAALRLQLTDALNRQTCEGGQPYVCHALATARSRLADIEAQNRVMWDVANDREARLAEAELSRDSWKREAELNQQAADESAEYARRLAEVEQTIREHRYHAGEQGATIVGLRSRLAEAEAEKSEYHGKAAALMVRSDTLAARLAEVHKTLAPLVDDDNRPVEALARHAVARLAEAEAPLAEARANAFQDALDCMRDRQARDHLAACLQDKYGVWWKTDSADKDQFWSGLQAEIDAQWPEQPTSDKRQISPEANTDSASVEGEK